MAQANPVPEAGDLHPDPADAERLFSSIERRRDEMIGTQTRPTPSPAPPPLRPWYRRPAVVFLMAIAAVMVVAVPLALFTGGGSEVIENSATTAPAPEASTTLPPTTAPATTVPREPPVIEPPFALEGWELVTPELDLTGGYSAGAFTRVVGTASGFLAIGGAGDGVWISSDGLEWAEVRDAFDPVGLGHGVDFEGVAVNRDRIAALIKDQSLSDGIQPRYGIATSPDGLDWTHTVLVEIDMVEGGDPDPTYSHSITAYGADGFIVSGTAIWLSTDGEQYEMVHEGIVRDVDPNGTERDPYPPRFDFRSSAADGQTAVLATGFGELVVTRDGETWELIPPLVGVDGEGQECSSVYLGALAHGPADFVAIGSCGMHGTVWTSPDGFTWSQIPYDENAFGEPAWISSIASSERGYMAGGRSGAEGALQAATVWTSPDGIRWTRVVLENDEVESGVLAVSSHEDTFVAVGWHEDDAAIWQATLAD
ncbi:MAG: hypothetical protein HKN80_03085 [Acidimicrobiia bacterium]|nr:hypothetical protein [Acidimicrobiia bacterium]